MDISKVTQAQLREDKFVDLLIGGMPKVDAAKKAYDIGGKMKGVITTKKLSDSATVLANRKLKSLSPENQQKMLKIRDQGVNKISELMEAKKGVFVMGKRVDEEPDSTVQLGAAKTALEYSMQKPTEKKEITHRTFFDACVRTIETDEDGNIIDDGYVEGEVVDD